MRPENKDELIAYHEAGHVVMLWCFRKRVKSACILSIPDADGNEGRVTPLGAHVEPNPFIHLMISVAGAAAEHNAFGEWRLDGSDYEKACKYLAMARETNDQLGAEPFDKALRISIQAAAYCLEREWDFVKMVAADLLKYRHLDLSDVDISQYQ